jgi:urease accessory protein
MTDEQRAQVMALARDICEAHPLKLQAGVSSPDARVVVLRVLSAQVENAMDLLRSVWMQWRHQCWNLPAVAPRIWAM